MNKLNAILVLGYMLGQIDMYGQSTTLTPDDEQHHILARMETLTGSLSDELFLSQKGVYRKDVVDFFFSQKTDRQSGYYTNIDMRLANDAIANSGEWMQPLGTGAYANKKSFLGILYPTKNDFASYNQNNVYFSLNPIVRLSVLGEQLDIDNVGKSSDWKESIGVGFAFRAKIKQWVGADFSFLSNQEKVPSYFGQYLGEKGSNPYLGYYDNTNAFIKNNFVRGNVHVPLIKDHITLSIGYDQHFIGDGYRSLMLSNFAGNALYGRIRTKVWKFQYQNLFLKYEPQHTIFDREGSGNKYAAIHHLSINIFPWLNIGLFESVIFNRPDRFEFGYLNPVIFYRSVERGMGSPDKLIVGANAKAILAKRINLYGQFIINEFTAKEFFSGSGYVANKWGAQLGLNYYDAFSLPNLDIQLEANVVRPYTYAAQMKIDGHSLSNYSHQNLALAHPLGAGFREAIMIIKYRPALNWTIDATAMYYQQGVDTDTMNYGNDILKDYNINIPKRYGVGIINGSARSVLLGSVNIGYQFWPQMFIDIGAAYRQATFLQSNTQSITYYAGIRMNIGRRNYAIF